MSEALCFVDESPQPAVLLPLLASIRSCGWPRICNQHALLPWLTRLNELPRQVSDKRRESRVLDTFSSTIPSDVAAHMVCRVPNTGELYFRISTSRFLGILAALTAGIP